MVYSQNGKAITFDVIMYRFESYYTRKILLAWWNLVNTMDLKSILIKVIGSIPIASTLYVLKTINYKTYYVNAYYKIPSYFHFK